MNKRGQVGSIVIVFIGIVVCLALIGSIATNNAVMTEKQTVTQEVHDLAACMSHGAVRVGEVNTTNPLCNITVTYAPTGWKIDKCQISSVSLYNVSGSAWVEDTDYIVYSNGLIAIQNTTDTTQTVNFGNDTLVTYTFCRDGYVTDSGSRSVTGLIVLFCALALAIFVYAMGRGKDWW